jgi:hypothetical protein
VDATPVHVTLDRITPSPLHDKTNRWIIFSDLHVKGSSIETCEAVLDKVHEAAVQRDAGIIFLGDFWHVRGALSVELLNRSVFGFIIGSLGDTSTSKPSQYLRLCLLYYIECSSAWVDGFSQ